MGVLLQGAWGYLEIVLAVACFLYVWVTRNDRGLPWHWPFVGVLPAMIWNLARFHERLADVAAAAAGGTFLGRGPWFLGMDMLFTADPANVHHIMTANFTNYPKGPKFKEIFDYLGDGIFNSDLDLWKRQRKATRFFVNHHRFHKYLTRTTRDKLEKELIPVVDHLCETGQVVDLQDLFRRFSFDVICKLTTGYDVGSLNINFLPVPFITALDTAEETVIFRYLMPEVVWKFLRLISAGQERKHSQACKALDKFVGEFISRKREEVVVISSKLAAAKSLNDDDDDDEDGVDLLTSFITQGKEMMESQSPCDDKSFSDTILNLMVAGKDGIASALTWFFWLLSQNPMVEMKIRQELIESITPPEESQKWRIFDAQDVNKLVYLHAALCETMRLYPPVPFQQKQPLEPDILPSGHHVHPKLKIIFSGYAMGRMTSIWGNDCMEMKPERWISDRGTIKHEPSYKFFAFNAGPRTCLGKQVSFTLLKAVAATLIHNYQIKVVPGQQILPNFSVILFMKHGLKVNLSTKRWA